MTNAPSDMDREVAMGYRHIGTLPGPGPWELMASRGGIVGVSPNWPNAIFISKDEIREIKVQASGYRNALLEQSTLRSTSAPTGRQNRIF